MEAMQSTTTQIFDETERLAELHSLDLPDTQGHHVNRGNFGAVIPQPSLRYLKNWTLAS